jgi:serine phosphatase RsbU (regulator of sigma subunit)
VSNDILRAFATEAAALIENARLVQAEAASRRYQQELSIAASIQQGLMEVTIPEVPFALLKGRSLSCKEIGGDFFDAVNTDEGLAVVLADVSGKGVSAALLASTLHGMIYFQLLAGMPLKEIVAAANRFFTHKHISEEYATLVVARLQRDGEMEYINCGHVPPLLVCNYEVIRPPHGNLPVGLLADATYESDHVSLHAGDRLILVTHGVTDAENAVWRFLRELAPGDRGCQRFDPGRHLLRRCRFSRRHSAQRRLHGRGFTVLGPRLPEHSDSVMVGSTIPVG